MIGQCPLNLGTARGQPVSLKVSLAQGHENLGGQRVDLLGSGQLLGRRALVVTGEKQLPLEPGRLPAVGIGPQGGLVDLVDHVIERIAQLFAPRRCAVITLGGLADQKQSRRVMSQVGRAGVVVLDEPLASLDRLFLFPPRFQQPGGDPSAEQMIGAGFERLFHPAVGGFPLAPVELQLRQPGRDVGVLGLLARQVFEALDRLGVFTLAGLAVCNPQRDRTLELAACTPPGNLAAAASGPREGLLRLGVAPVLEQPSRFVKLP